MIKDIFGRFDDYSISPQIRQILLHQGYELIESDLLYFFSLTTFVNIKMSGKTLKFHRIEVNKKEFNKSKQPIDLNLVDLVIVISEKFKDSDDVSKYFIGYKDDIIGLLCMPFRIKDDSVLIKYNKIWNKIKNTLNNKISQHACLY